MENEDQELELLLGEIPALTSTTSPLPPPRTSSGLIQRQQQEVEEEEEQQEHEQQRQQHHHRYRYHALPNGGDDDDDEQHKISHVQQPENHRPFFLHDCQSSTAASLGRVTGIEPARFAFHPRQEQGVDDAQGAFGFGVVDERGRTDTRPCPFEAAPLGLPSSSSLGNCGPSSGYLPIDDPKNNEPSFGNCDNAFAALQRSQFTAGSQHSLRSVLPLVNHHSLCHHQPPRDCALVHKHMPLAHAACAHQVRATSANGFALQGPCPSNLHRPRSSVGSGLFIDGLTQNNMVPCPVVNPSLRFLNLCNGGKFSQHLHNTCFQDAAIPCRRNCKYGFIGDVSTSTCYEEGAPELPRNLNFHRFASHSDSNRDDDDHSISQSFKLQAIRDVLDAESSPRTFNRYRRQHTKYSSLDEVRGQIVSVAKDQHGCRFLQKNFEEGSAMELDMIFSEIKDHISELMIDPFGNYLVQKLLEVCKEEQRTEVLLAVTKKEYELIDICLNAHGTRVVQKLIEVITTQEQISLLMLALRPGAVVLINDLNGNHVVQLCLQRFGNENNKFLLHAAADHCVEIATHCHGCCVLQRCVHYSRGEERDRLVAEIAANALILSQDPYGNYAVQYILEMKMSWAIRDVLSQLCGNYANLSMQKCSSNVVEKCLSKGGEEGCTRIIRELLGTPNHVRLLQDPYANYVIQTALQVSEGTVRAALLNMIRLHLPALRNNPYGKRILARANLS